MQWEAGEPVWYAKQGEEEHGAGVFRAVVVSYDDATVTVRVDDPTSALFNGKEVTCDITEEKNFGKGNVYPLDKEFDEINGYDDLVLLRNLNDAELNRNLHIRFKKDLSYCYCGNTCVAINLFYRNSGPDDCPKDWQTGKPVDVFSSEVKQQYVGKPRDANPPHIYAIVDEAFTAMLKSTEHGPPKKQAIVITGESGAGKTFTTYKVLDYVDTINQNVCIQNGKDPNPVTAKIRATMPIMDAFGNATMPRNDDSSRFGKLYKIIFDKHTSEVVGATIDPYLLEKSRVCHQASWERGFHIFYQLLFGADDALRQKLKLLAIHEYHYLNRHLASGVRVQPNSPALDVDGDVCLFHVLDRSRHPQLVDTNSKGKPLVNDAKNFNAETLPALAACGFSQESVDEILNITAGILMLGNVRFDEDDAEKMNDATIVDDTPLHTAAELLRVDPAALKHSFLHGKTGKSIVTNYSNQAASRFRDGLARALYNDMFVEIIHQFSSRLSTEVDIGSSGSSQTYMAVLDIFGFEFVEDQKLVANKLVNSLEQFCINLCNEKLQNHFVECVFLIEIKNLTDEGLQVTQDDFNFTPNDRVLELLQASQNSVIHELDDVCKNPSNASNPDKADKSFKDRLDKKFAKPTEWTVKGKSVPSGYVQHKITRRTYQGEGFKIRHYANDVLYDVNGWVEKNLDRVPSVSYECLVNSQFLQSPVAERSILQTFEADRKPLDAAASGRNKPPSPATLVSNFKNKLALLVDQTLTSKECRNQFVRCIKPNTVKKPRIYSSALVLNQLQYTGMLDTLRIRKAGFPTRPLHMDFYDKYKPLAPNAVDADSLVELLRERGELFDQKHMFVGHTRILMKDELARQMDAERGAKLKEWCLIVQSVWRGSGHKLFYAGINSTCTAALREIRRLLALGQGVAQLEADVNQRAMKDTRSFVLESVGMYASEAQERKMMRMEEEYGKEVELQRMMDKISARKAEHLGDAKAAYEQYKHAIAGFERTWSALLEEDQAAAIAPDTAQSPGSQTQSRASRFRYSTKFRVKSGRVSYKAGQGVVQRNPSNQRISRSSELLANSVIVTEL
eukprot:TRINITY_DN9160_c0_g5_i1.p1 TRINITY_DN9160_c0_g5~~TRINITY_DN9160_c0_g5_i1.p1  ORF type:complete len:1074 (+),score=297.10 TRINITY_DN9160_c0_g5_i1:181-3402(+)